MGYLSNCKTLLEKAGILEMHIIRVDNIIFETKCNNCETSYCKANHKKWTCPPHLEEINTLTAELLEYQDAIVFQASFEQKSGDVEKNYKCKQNFRKSMNKIAQLISGYCGATKLLVEGGCMICEECGEKKNKPCGFPNVAYSCIGAYGIDKASLLESCGLDNHGISNTINYVGILFIR